MSNVLGDNKQQQVLALGRGWSLRRIEQAIAVRRETASAYLKAAGIPVGERGGRPRVWPPKPATTPEVSTDSGARPAISDEVSASPRRLRPPGRAPTASACERYRELIAEALGRGRNAMAIWQDLVDDHGFAARYASVRRVVVTAARRRAGRGAGLPQYLFSGWLPTRGLASSAPAGEIQGTRRDRDAVEEHLPTRCAHAQ